MRRVATRQTGDRDYVSSNALRRGSLLISDRADRSADLTAILRAAGEVNLIDLDNLHKQTASYFRVFIDVNLANVDAAIQLRSAFAMSSVGKTPRYFVPMLTIIPRRRRSP